ncbi:efflux RND transporter permease subunit [Methylobacter sp.]|uniref:efflux RND transporter permease subunit n=1 Tax=Methylobacter sp. TaxID=2051955 RepID=UPI002FDE27AE
MIEKIIEYSSKNRFLVFLGVAFFAAWGVWALLRTPLDAIPDLSDVQVIIYTEWEGRNPTLIEDQVTYPLVTQMLSAPKVTAVRGLSFFGYSFVYILFEEGTDIYWARSRVLEYLAGAVKRLPAGVVPELGPDATGVGWVYEYALVDRTGKHSLAELRTLQDWSMRYWLKAVPGVSDVASLGGFQKQYQVHLDPTKLLAYKLSPRDIMERIRQSNNEVGGRVIEFAGAEFLVRGHGYVRSINDIEQIAVGTNEEGTPILMRDIAHVALGPEMRRGISDLDGEGNAVSGIVVMRFGENALKVIERIKDKIATIKTALPEGVEIVPVYDRSELILRSIATLKEKLIEVTIVVSVVCFVFLFHLRSALVAILTLPIAILLSFLAMYYLGLSSNIMSLGGIAIAVGAMVDAAIVMIENAHKRLEEAPDQSPETRQRVLIDAAKEVGRPLFFSLLVITVSFLPVFTLESQEGRLFKPLAYTKTFSMFFAAFLSITVVPLLMVLLIKGRITPLEKNPLNRLLVAGYEPIVKAVLRFRWATVFIAAILLAASIPVFEKLGSEFMPPLNEGTILYMPLGFPGQSVTESTRVLQEQDRIIKQFPEVEHVFGKAGKADTATDPAGLEMIETVITLKPEDQWRPGMTWDKLIDEMNQRLRLPGISNAWTMPIKARTDMLSTGIRTPVGIKISGPDLAVIEQMGKEIEGVVKMVPGARNVYAERVNGGYFLDFNIKRIEIARYGLTVENVQDVIESAIGGKPITTTIEGRERYTINMRYAADLRNDESSLNRILVPTPGGSLIPLSQLVDVVRSRGPATIRSEAGMLTGYIYVDVGDRDLGGFVEEAKATVTKQVKLPPGYIMTWSGQYEYMQRAAEKLRLVLPLTIFLIFLLLYFNFHSVTESLIVMISVPFALVGGFWYLYLLDYNLSVAVWVGIIALGGVAAETGVVMIVYLDEAYHRRKAQGRMQTKADLAEAIIEGSVQRIRPKMMTVVAIMGGLFPIMWSHGTGADVMKRIAAPMIGGMLTSAILTLLVIPAIYSIWKGWELKAGKQDGLKLLLPKTESRVGKTLGKKT